MSEPSEVHIFDILAEHKIRLIHKTEVFIQPLAELLNKQHLGEVMQGTRINVTSQSWPITMSNG